jgi:hypothetical protein
MVFDVAPGSARDESAMSMNSTLTDVAARYAHVLLREYGHEGSFEVEIADDDLREQVAVALEVASCKVDRGRTSRILLIHSTAKA